MKHITAWVTKKDYALLQELMNQYNIELSECIRALIRTGEMDLEFIPVRNEQKPRKQNNPV